ncbi:MAG: 50S ribosomal protein L15 [Desulfobacteraceae bacterium]|nr:50S ribosomal protein L15 [Desulfobacteraceae bacterium]
MRLHELKPEKSSTKNRKRLGRGVASGTGKTGGRGTKGHNSRSGGGVRPGFEGGQMPLQRRLPKRGFLNPFRKDYSVVNVRDLGRFSEGVTIDREALISAGVINGKNKPVKLLGQGEISTAVNVRVAAVSKSAREKIEAAGGKVEVA